MRLPRVPKSFGLWMTIRLWVYHVVDGQQRLTTFIIFLQAFVDFIRTVPENVGKPDKDIYITAA